MGQSFYLITKKVRNRNNLIKRFNSDIHHACILFTGLMLFFVFPAKGQQTVLDQRVTIPRQNTTLYKALGLISQKADVLFIYDSQVVESDKRVKLNAENIPLRQILDNILANPELGYKVIGQHILIYKIKKHEIDENMQLQVQAKEGSKTIVIKGHVYDNANKTLLPYATIGIIEENIGTVTNEDGFFTLKVPAALSGTSLVVSHMGFMSKSIPIQLIDEQKIDLFLERRTISIQEVIIRYVDPLTLVKKAMDNRGFNYNVDPVYTTSFYREGVQKNNRYISYSEAVFKVYKSSYTHNESSDQVKMLKSRKIQNSNPRDTVYLKLKGGVLSALQLDIVKCVPGFLDLSQPLEYTFSYSDVISYNSRDVYAITFVQNKSLKKALYSGTLYIDKESNAILGADFQINPAYLELATEDLVLKKSRKLTVKLEKIIYSVTYTPFQGKYYLNHARCEIQLKTRLRNHFTFDHFKTFLELSTCDIDTVNVVKFAKSDLMRTNIVFTDAPYSKDDAFWGNYNIIAPETELEDALSKIKVKIEEIK